MFFRYAGLFLPSYLMQDGNTTNIMVFNRGRSTNAAGRKLVEEEGAKIYLLKIFQSLGQILILISLQW